MPVEIIWRPKASRLPIASRASLARSSGVVQVMSTGTARMRASSSCALSPREAIEVHLQVPAPWDRVESDLRGCLGTRTLTDPEIVPVAAVPGVVKVERPAGERFGVTAPWYEEGVDLQPRGPEGARCLEH